MARFLMFSGRTKGALDAPGRGRFTSPAKRATALVLLIFVPGCTFTLGGNPNAADEVRAENLELKKQVDELNTKLELRAGEIDALRQRGTDNGVAMPGANVPMLSKIEFGRYSGAVDDNNDGRDDTVRVYVRTLDQRGRFLPVAGRGVLQVALIQPDAEPRVLAETAYDPAAWDAAYRAGITGTHYTLEVAMPDDLLEETIEATTKLTFTQADTGIELSTQSATRIDR